MSKAKKGKKKQKRVVDTWRSKEWYDVYAPQTFNEKFIGSVPCAKPELLVGRNIETVLFYITNNFADSHVKLKFKIVEVTGKTARTLFVGHDFTRDYQRSLVRRGSTKITGIFNVTTSDGVVLRVTAFVFTYGRAKASQRNTIRRIIHDVLVEHAKASKYSKFVQAMVYDKIAQNIQAIAREIFRIRECKVAKSKLMTPIEEIAEEAVPEDEEFESFQPEVKKHRKSVIRKITKQISETREAEKAEGEEATTEGADASASGGDAASEEA
ncbi:MAG: hypothetical protein Kow0069_03670 [Promethearchaeota archaeon]